MWNIITESIQSESEIIVLLLLLQFCAAREKDWSEEEV